MRRETASPGGIYIGFSLCVKLTLSSDLERLCQ